MSLLTGDALKNRNETFTYYDQFIPMFRRVSDHAPEGKEIGERILAIYQGKCKAATYALEFCMLARESGWNESALKAIFWQGLNANICTEMVCSDDKATLDSLIDFVIHLNNLHELTLISPHILLGLNYHRNLSLCGWRMRAWVQRSERGDAGRADDFIMIMILLWGDRAALFNNDQQQQP